MQMNSELKSNAQTILVMAVIIVVGVYFSITGIIAAQGFLAPLTVAGLLAMMFLPVVNKLEKIGFARGWAAFISVLMALVLFAGMFALVSYQVKQIADDWPEIKERLKPRIEEAQKWITDKTGIDAFQQEQIISDLSEEEGDKDESSSSASDNKTTGTPESKQKGSSSGSSSSNKSLVKTIGKAAMGFLGFLGVALLTSVYIFFILLYRSKIKKSILNFFTPEKREEAESVVRGSIRVSQSYLIGRFLLILILAVLYSIGLAISGVKHAILISILAAVLSLIPYIGNIIGVVLALAMAAFSGGSTMAFAGVVITFSIAQFVESYILEPYVVGHKVDLNPLITILVVVLGGAIWGVIGMIIFIPIFGIIKIVCDHIPALHPVGYLLGEEGIPNGDGEGTLKKWARKLKEKFSGK